MGDTLTITREVYNDSDELVLVDIVFDKIVWKNTLEEDQDEILLGPWLSLRDLAFWLADGRIISFILRRQEQ